MSPTTSEPDYSTINTALSALYSSTHLGVVTANAYRILDANDAFLRMIQYSREEMLAGAIDWRAMTPPESFKFDEIALQQLLEHGASVPFEKEYILRDGSRLPMLMGEIRLRPEPLEWMCYVVDLTDRKRAERAEEGRRQLSAKQEVINQIAHELNNPLAAVVFLVETIKMKVGTSDPEIREMFAQIAEMLVRMAALTSAVLAAGTSELPQV
jgi:PAS domain S-box-containing protein